jgi:type I restriction enzyme S subunit
MGSENDNWIPTSLGDIITLNYGESLPERKRIPGKIPVYGSNGITGYHNQALVSGPGIIVGRKGTSGVVHYCKTDYFPIDTTFYITPSKDYDLRFIYYLLQKLKLNRLNFDSAVPGLNRNVAYSINVNLPPLPEQQKIASILGALDDKIELNYEMNKTLEEMTEAIFKRWFVDFEFPDENGKPYKSSGGEMVYSEELQKEIPKGWEVKRVKEMGKVITGGTPSTRRPEYYGNDFPFVKIPDMRENVFVVRTESYISKLGAESKKKKLLPPLSVCVSCIATPGLVSLTYVTSLTNQQINSIICNKNISPYFGYLMMKNVSYEIILGGSGGTATLNLNKSNFSRIKVIIPDDETMKSFNTSVEPIFSCILVNQKESYDLSAIRDTLLPKLLSGEIRVYVEKDTEVSS